MADRIIVTPEQLRTQAGAVRTQLEQMQSAFDALKNRMAGTSAFWKGEAGDAHRQRYTERVHRIEDALHRYREQVTDLENMAGVYEQAERTASQLADSLPMSQL